MPPAAQLRALTVDISLRGANRGSRRSPVVRTLDGVDLTVPPGRLTALIGESGCGKSLVAAALCGLLPPGSRVTGRLVVAGTELTDADERRWRDLRGRHIGLVPQSAATSFTPVRTLDSQLAELCRRLGSDRTPAELYATVGLPAWAGSRYPHELSGGMAQRAAIAAALIARPGLLIADEPTSALDPQNADLVWRLLAEHAAAGAGVLVITHDLPSLLRAGQNGAVCDEIAVMRAGTVITQAPAADLIAGTDEYVSRFFTAAALP